MQLRTAVSHRYENPLSSSSFRSNPLFEKRCCSKTGSGQTVMQADQQGRFAQADVHAMHEGWQATVYAVKQSLVKKGAFQAEWFNCPFTPNATDYCWGPDASGRDPRSASLATCDMECQKSACTQYMRAQCKPGNESTLHKIAWMYMFTQDATTGRCEMDLQLL